MGIFLVGGPFSFLQVDPTIFYGCNSRKGMAFQKEFSHPVPTILHTSFPARAKYNFKSLATITINCRPDRSHTDYDAMGSVAKSNLLTGGNEGNLRLSVVDVRGHGQIKSMINNDNDYSRMRLGKNMLNFFNSSHKVTQARVGNYSKLDEFEALMDVGKALLKEGERGVDGSLEVSVASRMLEEAAVRFAAASASVVDISNTASVVIAWGITLLTHGKMKLLFSNSLREMLLEAKSSRQRSNIEYTADALRDMIPKVCEESEMLLVEAGRKLGKAVLLEKDNDFALYNWGLSLFYRARLIAANGLEDAIDDADKIYLIAIEKFKAASQLGKSSSGAAYLSWALALRDRFWLQKSPIKGDIKLLEQAKWASQQALQACPSGLQAKMVARICTEELAQCQMQ